MKDMAMKRKLVLLALLFVSQPFAQTSDGTVAKLTELKGNVLVSRESGLVSGNDAVRIVPGTRILTTANSRVVIVYDNGCRVTLEENQRFEVEDDKKPCALLLVAPIVAPAAVAGGMGIIAPLMFAGAALAPLVDQRHRQQVSPS
jgi:hypothetical protein